MANPPGDRAAKLIVAGIKAEFGDDFADLLEHAVEGETDLIEAIDTALAEIDETEILILGLKEKEGQFLTRRRAMEERIKRFRGLVEQAMAVAEQQKTAAAFCHAHPPKSAAGRGGALRGRHTG